MTAYASIEVELKGAKYTTEATDSAGLLFLSILFNEDETLLIRQGRFEDAVAMYSDRAASRMEQKRKTAKTDAERQKIDDQLNNEIMMELWQRIERSNPTRSLIAKRIKELFRFAEPSPIPERLVFWNSDEDNGINLSASDLLGLFSAVVGPTLADINKKKDDTAKVPEPIVAEAKAASIVPEVVTNTNPERDALLAQKSAIAQLLESNPSGEMRSQLEAEKARLELQLAS